MKTLRAVREALLTIYSDTEHREGSCHMACPCLHGGEHHRWASFTMGCFSQLHEQRPGGLAGRTWDLCEFIRIHDSYKNPVGVATVVVLALKSLANEFRSKEESLVRAITKSVPTQQVVKQDAF